MNPTAIYSKSGKGVQEASGKTSLLPRADRAVLSAIDGRANLQEVAAKVGKAFDPAFEKLINQLDKDGFIREVSSGTPTAAPKPAAAPPKPAAKPAAKPAGGGGGDFGDLDFSSLGGGAPKPTPVPAPSRPAAPPPRPAAAPPPAPKPQGPVSQPPKEQTDALAKAREEAEARAQAEREKMRAEAEAKTRAELEAKLREEAEKKMKFEAAAKAEAASKAAAAEAEAKVKAAKEAALKAAEAKVKAEAEAKAKIEAERKAREEMEKRLEEERKAREEAERKAKEEAERARKEAEEKARKEQEELRQRLEEERKAREEAERKAKEEAERVRRELEAERKRLEEERKREEEERAARKKREEEEAEARRKQREEEDRKAEEERAAKRKKREEEEAAREAEEQAKREAARKKRDEEEEQERAAKRKQREEEDSARDAEESAARDARRKKEEEQAAALLAAAEARKAQPKKPESFGDSLLADLDSFTNRDEEERKEKEEAERKAKAEAEARRREEADRQAKEEAERERRAAEERRRQEEQAKRDREEEERREQEEERRKREQEEIRRKAAAATAAAMAKEGKSGPASHAPASTDDIPISDDDLHMDEVKKEQAALAKTQAKEKEKEKEREKAAAKAERRIADEAPRYRKPVNWGKRIALTLVLLIVVGLVAVHVMPVNTADYERAATEAIGRPVKIGDGKMWLLTGPQIRFSNVTVGEARIAHVAAGVSPGSLFGDRKEFTTVELDGLTIPQQMLGEAVFATVKSENLSIGRIVAKSLELPGPAVLPKSLQAEVVLDGKGGMRAATLRGPDGLVARLVPKDESIDFDVVAAGFTLPIAPEVVLSKFGMKGSATQRGMKVDEWGGAIFNGGISGTASIRWGGTWNVEGVVTVRGINAAVFAPTLISNGTAEGTGRFTMTGSDPAKLGSAGRLDGNFTITSGTLGSYDLIKGIQSGGKQASGTTQFTEMTGQAVYDKGAVSLRNVNIAAGALNAGASADISSSGALSGRIVADVKTANRSQQATIVLGGTLKDPQVRN